MYQGEALPADTAPDTAPVAVAGVAVVDRLRASEIARCRLVFEQYELAAQLLSERVCERAAAGVPTGRWQVGVAAELALALRMSPHRAAGMLARARELHTNLPHTLARLGAGDLSPEAVPVIVSGLAHLCPADRRRADELLCADPATLDGLGARRVADAVLQVAYRLDRQGTVEHLACEHRDRRVSIRPVPATMTRLSILLPVAQGVGVYAALRAAALAAKGVAGETRKLAQIMADLAYQRLTGKSVAEGQDVAVNVTMPATVLLGDQPGTAHLHGGGTVPAEVARHLVATAARKGTAWVRRLYVRPDSGAVVGLDSRARAFPSGLADVIAARDRYCRTPYCDAPIVHIDHVHRHADGGATSVENGQGLCAACNYAKEGYGWHARTVPDPTGRHTVATCTPTRHTYRSTAPPPPT